MEEEGEKWEMVIDRVYAAEQVTLLFGNAIDVELEKRDVSLSKSIC